MSFVATLLLLPGTVVGWAAGRVRRSAAWRARFRRNNSRLNPVAQWTNPLLPFWFVIDADRTHLFHLHRRALVRTEDLRRERRADSVCRRRVVSRCWCSCSTAPRCSPRRTTGSVSPQLTDPQRAVPEMILQLLPAGARGVGLGRVVCRCADDARWSVDGDGGDGRRGFRLGARSIGAMLSGCCWSRFALASWLGACHAGRRHPQPFDPGQHSSCRAVVCSAWPASIGRARPPPARGPASSSASSGGSAASSLVGESGGYTWPWAIYGIPLIFLTGIGVSMVTAPREAR